MEIVVPIEMYAQLISDCSRRYCLREHNRLLDEPLSFDQSARIARAKVTDTLSWLLSWTTPTQECKTLLGRIVPAYDEDSIDSLHRTFYNRVLGSVSGMIDLFISDVVGDDHWHLWTLDPIFPVFKRYTDDVYLTRKVRSISQPYELRNGYFERSSAPRDEVVLDRLGNPIITHRKGEIVTTLYTAVPMIDTDKTFTVDCILRKGEDYRVLEWEQMRSKRAT